MIRAIAQAIWGYIEPLWTGIDKEKIDIITGIFQEHIKGLSDYDMREYRVAQWVVFVGHAHGHNVEFGVHTIQDDDSAQTFDRRIGPLMQKQFEDRLSHHLQMASTFVIDSSWSNLKASAVRMIRDKVGRKNECFHPSAYWPFDVARGAELLGEKIEVFEERKGD